MAATPGGAVNLNDDISRNALGAGISSIVLSSLFFAGRVASRKLKQQRLDLSDYLLMGGMICGWGISAMIIYGSTQGMGKHIAKVAETDPTLGGPRRIMQGLIAVECLYVISLGSIKISILLLYRTIFPGKPFRIITNIIGAIIIAWAIAIFWISIFACSPVSAFWTFEELPTAKCINTVQFYIGIWVPNIATDVMMMILPQTKVWKLQVGLKSKIAIALMFLLGSFVMVASVIRFTTLFQVDLRDSTWTISTLGVWTCVELCVAVASASMPIMRPLFQKFVPAGIQSVFRSQNETALTGQHNSRMDSKANRSFGYGVSLGSRSGDEEFERLPDLEGRSQAFVMSDVGNKGGVRGKDESIVVTKTWDMRSRDA
ncbi:hypothetical protein BGZ60DRAFT_227274 [Tricladium varicosporioides]|nr:hypothetical protein BGZ60DRAFT_227274 [Hymenoscyphus varicosporioides]